MVEKLIVLIGLIFISLTSNSQIILQGKNVLIPLPLYKQIRLKYYYCDTIMSIKDSLISELNNRKLTDSLYINSLKSQINYNDSTLNKCKNINNILIKSVDKYETKLSKNKKNYFLGGVITGVITLVIIKILIIN